MGGQPSKIFRGKDKCSSTLQKNNMSIENPVENLIKNSEEIQVLEVTSSGHNSPFDVHLNKKPIENNILENTSGVDNSSKDSETLVKCVEVFVNEPPNDKSIEHAEVFKSDQQSTIQDKTMDTKPNSNHQIRILTLEDGRFQDDTLYRLKKGWYLEFRLGASLFGYDVIVYTNIPAEGCQFDRKTYRRLEWIREWSSDDINNDDSSLSCLLQMNQAGSFHYYYEHKGQRKGSGYINVDPNLVAGGKDIPLESLQTVSVLVKCLGQFSSWKSKLQVAKESGYNMIHFTPIQELGGSRSCYSLKNQLALNSSFSSNKYQITLNDVKSLTEEMKKEWNVLSICDIVLNHTANESSWLLDHPECTYNLVNCPYLKPAYLLDYILYHFSVEVSKGMWEFSGVPTIVDNEEHLASIRHAILATLLPRAKIHELFQLNIDRIVTEFQEKVRAGPPPLASKKSECNEELILVPDPEYRRLSATIDMDKALRLYNIYRNNCFDEDTRLHRCSFELKLKLEALNNKVFDEVQGHLTAAVDNSIAGIRYFRVQSDGPKLTKVCDSNPLVPRYFTDFEDQSANDVMYSPNGRFIMAHNGWVMGGDPLSNFAGPDSNVYFRRELIAWGDSVKLRYGDGPSDCPFLWNHMQRYVEQTVTIFDGIRLDNCHSTPLHVAEYLLDAARKIRPDLYVVAELFTNSDATDNIYVNRLGITSLIREAMSAWDSHELGRLVYRYGGEPVGGFIKPSEQPLRPSVAHALFMDQTHDNPSPIEKRTVYDLLPSAALVSMACCASGSNMGYDQLVPHHIHVVDEERQYMSWSDDEINSNTGIVAGKKALNELHYDLGNQGFNQVYVDQIDTDIVCVTRHNSNTHDTVVLMSYTSFSTPSNQNGLGKGITVSGKVENLLIEASLEYRSLDTGKEFVKDLKKINGLNNYVLNLKKNTSFNECSMLEITPSDDKTSTRLNFTENFKPGCVVAVSFVPLEKTKTAFEQLLADIDLAQAVSRLTLTDMNYILFRCAEEDEGNIYDIPGFGKLTYCGIQGFISILDTVAPNNDLGHPLCTNLRNGLWIVDYICGRLKRKEFENCPLYQFGDFLERYFQPLKNLPSYLVPSFFELTLRKVYNALLCRTWSLMPGDIKNCSTFCKSLALASIQFAGIVKSSPLPTLSPNLLAPLLKTQGGPDGKDRPECITLAAGLPHFSSGYMRNWGRDTFISLRGLLLLTGRFEEAKFIILGFGGCLRHGLIPNLLDGGSNPRYNCRDAVWWWLYVIQQYVEVVPGGISILDDPVNRIFPTDDSVPTSVEQPLHEVIQEVMEIHFQGLCFRERNAGTSIDAHMKSPGFNNQIGVQPSTGFVFGGNEWNCGTWMDKMGSSDKAGNRGRPATPRDGSAIELIALSKSTVGWLAKLNKTSKFKYSGVSRKNKDESITTWTYEDWNTKIQNNFESYFWIPKEKESRNQVEPHPELINCRGIYKDTVGASNQWGDYQLRCNYPVAMVVAPELFTPDNARIALQTVSDILLGPLGIKTLDPSDWSYNGFYDNDNDTPNPRLANGFNYHQGPEWLWPVGFFLRAKLIFSTNRKETSSEIQHILSKHYEHIKTSVWRGLPELTNKDGEFCAGSCPTQAWSVATILETLMDITNLNLN